MVGFNRRFSPHIIEVKKRFRDIPLSINYRINAGIVPKEHWVHDPDIGGGRILGEVCHFIDLCSYTTGSEISAVTAFTLADAKSMHDTVVVNLSMKNGSVATISYFANGNSELQKERMEIFGGGSVAIIDDFKTMNWYGTKTTSHKLSNQDKGHAMEMKLFAKSILQGSELPIPFRETYKSMKATFLAIDSSKNNGEIRYL